jgi:hypothetical protein
MKVHKIEIIIVDHDELGATEIKQVIENSRYPNHCISPNVHNIKTIEIGAWDDNSPFNFITKQNAEFERIFNSTNKGE